MSNRAGNASKKVVDKTPGPWTTWRGSRTGRAIRFIETYVRPPRGAGAGKPLRLLSWEREWLEEIYAEGIGAGALSIARGNGKSTLGAALATEAVFTEGDQGAPVVPVIATTVMQATRALYGQVQSIVAHEPELANRSLTFTGIGTSRIVVPRTEGQVFPVSSDPDGLQGLDIWPLGIADEFGFLEPEAWTGLLMARKRPGAVVLGMGTPGFDRSSPLYATRQLVKDGAPMPGLVYREFSGEPGADIHDEANWYKANPSIAEGGFPSLGFLRNAAAISPESHFRIFHLAEFDVDGVECWLGTDGRAIWSALGDPYAFIDKGATWVGVDVGLKRDSTAVVAVQFRPDGRLHAKCRLWMPTQSEPVDATDVMAYLRDLCRQFQVGAIAFDARFFDVPAKLLLDEGLPMVELPQSVERMTPICGNLYELIRGGKLSHDRDARFTEQVLNAIPRMNERGFTLSKGKSRGRIDASIALGLAVDRAQHRTAPRPPVIVLWAAR